MGDQQSNDKTARLRIIATTDLHGAVFPHDYYTDSPSPGIGLACAATLIAQARSEAINTILVDNGDTFQGSLLADQIASDWCSAENFAHPIVAAMNVSGYDAMVPGNHDLNFGLSFLTDTLRSADFPVVSTNLRPAQAGRPSGFPEAQTILTRSIVCCDGRERDIHIGICGFLPPRVMNWDRDHVADVLSATSIVETARDAVAQLREQGADIILALAHTGIGEGTEDAGGEDAALALAAVQGIDAIVTGHRHRAFPGPDVAASPSIDPVRGSLHGKPAVMAGIQGSHIGIIDLELQHDQSRWRVVRGCATVRATTAETAPDPTVLSACKGAHERTLARCRTPLGHLREPVENYFALIAPSSALALVANAQAAQAQVLLDQAGAPDIPCLSAIAPFRAGGPQGVSNYTHIPAGPVLLRDIANLYVHPNRLRVLRVSGAQLRRWLMRAAQVLANAAPADRDVSLLSEGCLPHDFDVFFGLSYAINLTAECPADRIENLQIGERAIEPMDQFHVVTNSFRAEGAAGFEVVTEAETVVKSDRDMRDVVADYIAKKMLKTINLSCDFHVRAAVGSSFLYKTAPDARPFVPELREGRISHVENATDGFDVYRLEF